MVEMQEASHTLCVTNEQKTQGNKFLKMFGQDALKRGKIDSSSIHVDLSSFFLKNSCCGRQTSNQPLWLTDGCICSQCSNSVPLYRLIHKSLTTNGVDPCRGSETVHKVWYQTAKELKKKKKRHKKLKRKQGVLIEKTNICCQINMSQLHTDTTKPTLTQCDSCPSGYSFLISVTAK